MVPRWRSRSTTVVRRVDLRRLVFSFLLALAVVLLLAHRYGTTTTVTRTPSNEGTLLQRYVPYHGPTIRRSNSSSASWFNEKQAKENAMAVQEKRRRYHDKSCRASNGTELDWFSPPTPPADHTTAVTASQPCMFTLIDLGANVGDSLGKFIDAGINAECTGRYSVAAGRVRSMSDDSVHDLTAWTRKVMEQFAASHVHRHLDDTEAKAYAQPENYCYVGVEGNPSFTKRLLELQQRVLLTTPRPLRSVRFMTETVGTGAGDGPTKLYLDTVNAQNNFFGSSLLPEHTDVRRSATANGGTPVSVPVNGITLSTLLKETVVRHAGSHVILKIDIEGAEYSLLNEAYNSGVLCDYAASGVRIDARVEIHPKVRKLSLTICGDTLDLI
jgi:Methyltransferase FkbM domain